MSSNPESVADPTHPPGGQPKADAALSQEFDLRHLLKDEAPVSQSPEFPTLTRVEAPQDAVCQHGGLRRQCATCDAEAEQTLRASLEFKGCIFCKREPPPPHVCNDEQTASVCFDCIEKYANCLRMADPLVRQGEKP